MNYYKYIPSFEECKEICDNAVSAVGDIENNTDKKVTTFFSKTYEIENKKVVAFNYGIFNSYQVFENPLSYKKHIKAHELRGITFVQNDDGTYDRYLVLPKFFNIDQYEQVQYKNLKDKEIARVQEKRDGSMISFIRIKDKLYPKTIKGFSNTQCETTNKFLRNNSHYENFIHDCLDKNITPIFELTSPSDRIIIERNTMQYKVFSNIRRCYHSEDEHSTFGYPFCTGSIKGSAAKILGDFTRYVEKGKYNEQKT